MVHDEVDRVDCGEILEPFGELTSFNEWRGHSRLTLPARSRPTGPFSEAWPTRYVSYMLLAELVDTWDAVRDTRSRKAKIELLASRLEQLDDSEIEIGVSFLAGEPRQGRLGVGYRTLYDTAVPAAGRPTLTLTVVDDAFQQLTRVGGPGSKSRRAELLEELLGRATEPEQAFFRGLILGELRQGALEGVMVEAIASASGASATAVRRALMLSGSLPQAGAAALRQGETALARFRLTLFVPIKPMLAQTAGSVEEALSKIGAASVEAKYDGARVQVHRHGDRVAVYTRNLRDITNSVPELAEAVRELKAESLILDGEAMSFFSDGTPEAFQDTISRFAQQESGGGLVGVFFDCLHLDGRDLIDLPSRERFSELAAVAGDLVVSRLATDDPEEAKDFYDDALAQGQEGVMVKDLDAPYQAGRRGAAWLKVKPAHTLDLVVLGVEWGSGRREGWLSNLHLGARDPTTGGFVMLGKTFKGLTDEMLAWQTERFLQLKEREDGRVVYVRPEQVVEVAFDGVQGSPRYPGGVALRFARVKRYRDDKAADETDTIDAVRALRKGG